jgi:hypothetical protein
MEELEAVRKAEDANYRHSRKMIGEIGDMVQDFVQLYAALGTMVQKRHRRQAELLVIVGQSLMACRTDLIVGSLATLRGHLGDSFMYTRRAIEFCAFAAAVQREPVLARIWRDSGRDRPSYNKYLRTFRTEKLFPKTDSYLVELAERYNIAAKYAHPSRFAFAGRVGASSDDVEMSLTFDYFQVSNADPSEPARTMLWILNTHFVVLLVFERLMVDAMGRDRNTWVAARESVASRLDELKANWGPILRAGQDKEA